MDNEREVVLENFFKTLRITLNNCSVYFKEHPLFVKSIEDFKSNVYAAFKFINPLTVGVTTNSLFVAGKYLEKNSLYVELASFLHRRKIKKIEIRNGVSGSEISTFIVKVALPAIDIFKEGGLSNILEKEGVTNIIIEELDYSLLLREQGEEQKDVWAYLLQKAIKENNSREIKELVDNFDNFVNKININDFVEDEKLNEAVKGFFVYLKDRQADNLNKCGKELLKSILRKKDSLKKERINQLAALLGNLDETSIASVLSEEMISDDNFDLKNMQLFSLLVDRAKHEKIALSVAREVKNDSRYNLKVARKIKELFTSLDDSSIFAIYKKALSSLLSGAEVLGGISFNRQEMQQNYCFMLVNLIAEEKSISALSQLIEKVFIQLQENDAVKDIQFIKYLFQIFKERISFDSGSKDIFESAIFRLSKYVEESAVSEKLDLNKFEEFITRTSLGKDFYYNKIFTENIVNPNILRLFLGFFPNEVDDFCKKIKSSHADFGFLKKHIESLRGIDSGTASSVLIYIYPLANRFLKMEILKVMQGCSNYDKEFVFSLLSREDAQIKKQAIEIVKKNSALCLEAAKTLLLIPNRFGLKNKIIEENIDIIDEAGLKEAGFFLQEFSRIRCFWKKSIKEKSVKVLKKWHDRKN